MLHKGKKLYFEGIKKRNKKHVRSFSEISHSFPPSHTQVINTSRGQSVIPSFSHTHVINTNRGHSFIPSLPHTRSSTPIEVNQPFTPFLIHIHFINTNRGQLFPPSLLSSFLGHQYQEVIRSFPPSLKQVINTNRG